MFAFIPLHQLLISCWCCSVFMLSLTVALLQWLSYEKHTHNSLCFGNIFDPFWLLLVKTWSCQYISGEPYAMIFPIACFFQNTVDKHRHKPWSWFYEVQISQEQIKEVWRTAGQKGTQLWAVTNGQSKHRVGASFNKLFASPNHSAQKYSYHLLSTNFIFASKLTQHNMVRVRVRAS